MAANQFLVQIFSLKRFAGSQMKKCVSERLLLDLDLDLDMDLDLDLCLLTHSPQEAGTHKGAMLVCLLA